MEFGEDLITWVCLELNARALVCSWKMENMDDFNVGVVGGIYSPNHQISRLVGLTAHGAPDSPVHTGLVRCASHVTKAVGIRPLELCLLGPPGCPVAHRTCTVECPVRQYGRA